MKLVLTRFARVMTELVNRSMAAGHFPLAFTEALITPVLKKYRLKVTNVLIIGLPPNL